MSLKAKVRFYGINLTSIYLICFDFRLSSGLDSLVLNTFFLNLFANIVLQGVKLILVSDCYIGFEQEHSIEKAWCMLRRGAIIGQGHFYMLYMVFYSMRLFFIELKTGWEFPGSSFFFSSNYNFSFPRFNL